MTPKDLPEITTDDKEFLTYNPNTSDVIEWIQKYAAAAYELGARSTALVALAPEVDDALREVGKWLNEQPNRPIDRVAVAVLCAALSCSTAAQPAGLVDEATGQIEYLDRENHRLAREAWTWSKACEAATRKLHILSTHHPRLEVRYWTGSYWEPMYGVALDRLLETLAPAPPAATGDSTPPSEPADGEQLWLWQNGDHFLAFRHLYPCYSPNGDPMTLGEPFGRAIFKHSHNREGKPNEQQRTDRQSPRSGANPDIQRRRAAGASQACAAGAGASLGYGEHQAAPQVGWGACSDGAREQQISDIAGAAGVLAAGRNFAQGVAAQGDSIGALRPEPEAAGQDLSGITVYSPCERHKGLPIEFTATVSVARRICPRCEQEKTGDQR